MKNSFAYAYTELASKLIACVVLMIASTGLIKAQVLTNSQENIIVDSGQNYIRWSERDAHIPYGQGDLPYRYRNWLQIGYNASGQHYSGSPEIEFNDRFEIRSRIRDQSDANGGLLMLINPRNGRTDLYGDMFLNRVTWDGKTHGGSLTIDRNLTVNGTFKLGGVTFNPNGFSSLWTPNGNDISYSDGNVGIGTVSPTEKLEVDGTVKGTKFIGERLDVINPTAGNSHIGYLNKFNYFSHATNGHTYFRSYDQSTGTFDYALAIKGNSGNVGIGTMNPSEKLEVDGAIKATDFLDANGNSIINGGGGSSVWQGSGDIHYNSGNVGIGTMNPSEKLEVTNDILISATDDPNQIDAVSLKFRAAGQDGFIRYDETGRMILGNGSSNAVIIKESEMIVAGSVQADDFLDANGNSIINGGGGSSVWQGSGDIHYSSGNVGIGTTTPTETLEVAGGVRADVFRFGASDLVAHGSAAGTIELRGGSPYVDFNVAPGTDYDGRIILSDANTLSVAGANLNVVGDYYKNGQLINLSTAQLSPGVWQQNGSFLYAPNSTTNVGIGIANPAAKLDVRGDILAKQLNIENNKSGNSHIGFSDKDNYITHSIQGGTYFRAYDFLSGIHYSPGIAIKGSGRLGIGTLDPTERLEVVGTIKATDFVDANGNSIINGGGGPWGVEDRNFEGGLIQTLKPLEPSGILSNIQHVLADQSAGNGSMGLWSGDLSKHIAIDNGGISVNTTTDSPATFRVGKVDGTSALSVSDQITEVNSPFLFTEEILARGSVDAPKYLLDGKSFADFDDVEDDVDELTINAHRFHLVNPDDELDTLASLGRGGGSQEYYLDISDYGRRRQPRIYLRANGEFDPQSLGLADGPNYTWMITGESQLVAANERIRKFNTYFFDSDVNKGTPNTTRPPAMSLTNENVEVIASGKVSAYNLLAQNFVGDKLVLKGEGMISYGGDYKDETKNEYFYTRKSTTGGVPHLTFGHHDDAAGSLTSLMTIDKDGKVGIGKLTPTSVLHLKDNDVEITLGKSTQFSQARIMTKTNHALAIGVNDETYIRIEPRTSGNDNNGYVVVGYNIHEDNLLSLTNKEKFDLVVGRGVLSEDIAVQARGQWGAQPDYVFAEDYELTTLEELEQFIKTNKHLPDVPSVSQIKEDGYLSLVDQTIGTLKNLEEQVLQNIAQEKKITSMKSALSSRKAEIEKLNGRLADQEERLNKLEALLKTDRN